MNKNSFEGESDWTVVECDCGAAFEISFRFRAAKKDKSDREHLDSRVRLKNDKKTYVLNSINFVRCSGCQRLISHLGLNAHILNEQESSTSDTVTRRIYQDDKELQIISQTI